VTVTGDSCCVTGATCTLLETSEWRHAAEEKVSLKPGWAKHAEIGYYDIMCTAP
jgi:hypothetical protein